MRVAVVLAVLGRLLRLFSLAFVPPLALALADGDRGPAVHFAVALATSVATGSALAALSRVPPMLQRSEALFTVGGTWFVVAHFGAIPYLLAGLAPADAVFESMSGFTTTGATVLRDFGAYGRAFFLWRAMTQWFGGLGVIALFVVVLPQLGIAGRQLFFAEASPVSEAVSPQVYRNARRLWAVYAGLTAAQTILLVLTGLPLYESVVHSLTTLSAGGFSPHPQSVGGYANPAAEWVFVVFMILGGTSFPLQWKALSGRPLALLRDGEFLLYFGAFAGGSFFVAVLLGGGLPDGGQLRAAAFQSASLISSSGFASADYDRWGDGARAVLVLLMVLGGCAGSAAGGAKSVRYLVVLKILWREVTQVIHPYGVVPVRYGRRTIPTPVLRAVAGLVILYLFAYLLVGVGVVLSGADLVTGFSASLACVGNIGPGFAGVGPLQNYASLTPAAKALLTLAMWVGRLEIVTVLALFHPDVWKHPRWGKSGQS
ncbi:MAG: TrkH family potassium uptake protein [Planctomycetota bacterium]